MFQTPVMYQSLKKIVHLIVPKKTLFRIEPSLRTVFAMLQTGKNHTCTICSFNAKKWTKISNNDNLCPNCGSLSRDRRLWKLLNEKYLQENKSVLDFSPSRSLFRKWKKIKTIDYTASDLSGDFIADVQFDITNISKPDESYDLIICYHILEHVVEDIKAMQELFRVLKPNGTIWIQTPFKEGEIYEDYTITSEAERLIHFGQEDHVRFYSVDGLKKRLESVGFTILVNEYEKDDYLGFSNEIILLATK